jgi:agmatinase
LGSESVWVLGAPTDLMSITGSGSAAGPAAVRLASESLQFRWDPGTGRPLGFYDYHNGEKILEGTSIVDIGDIRVGADDGPAEIGSRLAQAIILAQGAGAFPLILGGDHSILSWALRSFKENNLTLLHLDAHTDIAPLNAANPTNGNVVREIAEKGRAVRIVTVGLRGILPREQLPIISGHTFVSVRQMRSMGVRGLLRLLPKGKPCYVSIDLDVLDPSVGPGTNTPVPGGFSFGELQEIVSAVGQRRRIIGADLVELNPKRDRHQQTSIAATHIALSLLGAVASDRISRNQTNTL